MKLIAKILFPLIITSVMFAETLPLSQRYFHTEDMGYDYSRGTFLIVLADESLEDILTDDQWGNFIHFKQNQGYKVEVITFAEVGGQAIHLRSYLEYYYNNDPLLEYVLLIGDINGTYAIPSFTISSYNEDDLDVTDYPYTFSSGSNPLEPNFFLGRWSIRSQDDLKKLKMRTIQYLQLDYADPSYLNNALLVAGNYSDSGTWPVTPVWTSKWLMDELYYHGTSSVTTAFFHLENQQVNNPLIQTSWNNGVGVINYRGWGDANGWHFPYFHRENVDELSNGLRMPIVLSFVCNTGDFGNDFSGSGLDKCFGEVLITAGSVNNPKGAVAMIGPSDLDTDTRFNNAMCGVMWDEMLEERIPELAPALHAGKHALIKEFGSLEVNGTNIAEFYHHVYGVLGDPSLPVWLGEPQIINADLGEETSLTVPFISTFVRDESGNPLMDVVGALIVDNDLIGRGLSNQDGYLYIDFFDLPDNTNMKLYLNKPQYFQKKINLTFQSDEGGYPPYYNYEIPAPDSQFVYIAIDSESGDPDAPVYNWIEIKEVGENLNLTDDSIVKDVDIGFNFQYYGYTFNKLTVCSNGWASFYPCLSDENNETDCTSLPYFFNNSITHPVGPYGMLAPFFDDLDDNEGIDTIHVYSWQDAANQRFIIEWDNIANGQHDEDCIPGDVDSCPRETFQLILDGANIAESGNGEIIFQYKEVNDVDDHGSTIGIESPDKNTGTEYLFNYNFSAGEGSLINELAIKFVSHGVINMSNEVPSEVAKEFQIIKTFPNPFNPVSTIRYDVVTPGKIRLNVYNILGRNLETLFFGYKLPGKYEEKWNAAEYPSGLYFIQLTGNGKSVKQKIMLLK